MERLVLFIGTPCQVSAIKAYIGKDSPYLLTADFLCHGTPSPLLLQKYMDWRQGQYRSRMVGMGFRGKEVQGWLRSSIDCRFVNGRVLHTRIDFDPFYGFFASLLSVNNACFACRYASLTRMADITAMDYWHAPQELLRERGRLGMSLVLAHTAAGREIIHRLRDEGTISTRPAELAGYYRCQPAFCHAPAKPARWDDFMRDLPLGRFPLPAASISPQTPIITHPEGAVDVEPSQAKGPFQALKMRYGAMSGVEEHLPRCGNGGRGRRVECNPRRFSFPPVLRLWPHSQFGRHPCHAITRVS